MTTEARDVIARSAVDHLRWLCNQSENAALDPMEEAIEVTDLVLAALTSAGWAVVKLPTVAFKGPHDTDAKFFRQVADRLEDGRSGYVGGSNVRAAVSELLRSAAKAAEAEK